MSEKTPKESPYEPKSLPIYAIAQRFLERGQLALSPMNPGRDLLYVNEEKSLYTFTDKKYFRPIVDTDFFIRKLAKFFDYEKSELGSDLTAPEPVKPLHPQTPVDLRFLLRLEDYIPLVLPEDQLLLERPPSSITVFSDGFARDLGDPDSAKIEANRSTKAFFYVDFPSTIFEQKFEPLKECPRFVQYLKEVLVTEFSAQYDEPIWDPELVLFIQEILGFCLLSGNKSQCAFFFTGTGQNGKSILLKLIEQLFPPDLVSSLSIGDISTSSFRASGLIGKQANIVHEEESEKINIAILKNLISGEPMQVERKYKDAVRFVPRIKFFWGTNKIPSFEDIDPALKRRIFIVPFFRMIPNEKKDPDLDKKLKEELPGIFHFAFEGAKQLIKDNFRFRVPKAVEKSMEQFELERYPAKTFFHDHYDITGDLEDKRASLVIYQEYSNWCDENGHRNKLSFMKFIKQIDEIDKKNIKNSDDRWYENGERVRGKLGIKRKNIGHNLTTHQKPTYGHSSL